MEPFACDELERVKELKSGVRTIPIDETAIGRLAALLRDRNRIDEQIAALIGRPALTGHIGEWIAAQIFGVKLEDSASQAGIDGCFTEPPLVGRTVNVKFYGVRTNVLDMKEIGKPQPGFYLAMTGPKAAAASSRGCARPCVIREVFLFETGPLIQRLGRVKIGISTSVREQEWEAARIYPITDKVGPITLRPDQVAAITALAGNETPLLGVETEGTGSHQP
jgi:hypothetical protein